LHKKQRSVLKKPNKTQKTHFEVVFLGGFFWALLGGFFIANPEPLCKWPQWRISSQTVANLPDLENRFFHRWMYYFMY
jgi:hypothetical protein